MADAGRTYEVRWSVRDDGTPAQGATQSFHITVTLPRVPELHVRGWGAEGLRFEVTGDEGPDYVIERAEDLVEGAWQPVVTNLAPVPPFVWTDTNPPPARAYYRVRLAP